ncbi:FAD:protein FMN transferase [Singulisphaera acidiphila]|uniref:FAD:protein FMN transferase n=1 Tax=Singulisphaera acidiphila (strain ATCC BAA-1392 / DSM 18658 / VKM B-2454 / MOB10) TaxID=886293 RepID=L0DB94_SINAD|nr:FAD:protein FMN transferase [Singulisphaera acidiphila]AGA25906.1 membrane-associated lipoprotein involved in thiamine biosynthesis [Singulisphaera acidiphila DSM 18658]
MRHPRPRVNRRDLLRLRRFNDATPVSNPVSSDRPSSGDLIKATRPAMGSYFEVRIAANTPGGADLVGRVLDRIDELETQLTVYRDDSEVSRLNAAAHRGPIEVEPGLFRLLELALELGRATGGAYDVTTGALSEAWGFFKGPRRVPSPQDLADARERTGQHHLSLDPERRTVTFDRAGVAINLGSIGKGYAIDAAAEVVKGYWWPTSALIHGGRSSLYALGSPPGQFGGRWEIAVRNPFQPETPLGILRLRNRGMGTSGTDFQRFESDGRIYGHILDPRTGEPAFGPASVTVLAPTAAEADALSTAFYLLGPAAAASYVTAHPEIGAIFVNEGDADGSPSIVTFGLTDDDFLRDP